MFKEGYIFKDGIFVYPFNDKTVEEVKNFYEDDPFPNYEFDDDRISIQRRGDKNSYTYELKKFIGYGKKIIEIGSGTCQLSNYLAIGTNNSIVALDANLNSLKIGKKFSEKNNIKNIQFVCADIFDERIENCQFHFVICNGVLHHTKNSFDAFNFSLKLLKKDGFILVGLYNSIGRIRTKFRGFLYKLLGKKYLLLFDPVLRKIDKKSEKKINAWIKDQYIHPVERSHSFDEVLTWFKKKNLKFINSYPPCDFFKDPGENDHLKNLFIQGKISSSFERLLSQIKMFFSRTGSEGGLFFFLGKKENQDK
jgi:2-polyprenyl-3-methyl-5-hydroxy-6-metoxy-1,4-benzoquinol methylase